VNTSIAEYLRAQKYHPKIVEGGVNYLIDEWRKLVAQIHSGFQRGIDEYRNDLDGRTILEEVIPLLRPEDEREKILKEVSLLDAEFRNLTIDMERCVNPRAKHWWDYRLPPGVYLPGE
jgi:hypothetical protein